MDQQHKVAPARFILLELAEQVTGYTVKAMERKIEEGVWAEGEVWRRAPDGRRHLDLVGYEKWVLKGTIASGTNRKRRRAARELDSSGV